MKNISPVSRLWNLLLLERKEITSIYFYAILSGLVQLSVPIGVQAIIGFVLGASMVTSIYVLIFLVVLGVIIVGIMQINQMKIIEKIQQNIFIRYAFAFAERIPSLDLKKMDNYYLPEKVNRFFDSINVQKGLSKLLLDIPLATIQILFGLILLALYHPVFILFGSLLVIILLIILRVTSRQGLSTSIQESNYKYSVVAWLQEMARTIKSFKFSQGSHFNLIKTDANALQYIKARTAHFKVLLFQYRSLVFFKVTITTAMLTVGTYLLLDQQLNIGEFIAAEIVILTVIGAIEKVITSLDSIYDVITGLEKLATVTESYVEKSGTIDFNVTNGVAVELNEFNFNFTNATKVLHNVDIAIPPYSLVAVSGSDGSGKSTLLRVLSGSYSEFQGAILINNIPINNYNLEKLRNHTGCYFNQLDIFEGTIQENINMGRTHITQEKIMHVAELLGISEFINNMPAGLETTVDNNGKKLPHTLVRKIQLLRALCNNPSLILMEEPWLGLADYIKQNIIKYLKLQSHATRLVASNDADFITQCDYHIHITNGNATITKVN